MNFLKRALSKILFWRRRKKPTQTLLESIKCERTIIEAAVERIKEQDADLDKARTLLQQADTTIVALLAEVERLKKKLKQAKTRKGFKIAAAKKESK